jgi:peptidoglycan/xylan/chitin deacetylase (PgdA/CDA1 family)
MDISAKFIKSSKGALKSLAGHVLFSSGRHAEAFSNAAIIVAFHRVNDDTPQDGLTCGVRKFEQYCEFFRKYFHVVRFTDIVERLQSGRKLDRCLAISFDDGYLDNYTNARPILKRLNLPATFFVTTNFIGSNTVAFWDQPRPRPWMTWDHVRTMKQDGFEVGAHTRSHVDLGVVSGKQAWDEIHGSKVDLEEQLDAPVKLFAYPFGSLKHITKDNQLLIERAGFISSCSCHGGVIVPGTNPFVLRRAPVSSWFSSPNHFGIDLARVALGTKRQNCARSFQISQGGA